MRIINEGVANRHDLVHVTCPHCGTNVTFWRDEPGTVVECISPYAADLRFIAQWKCPVCDIDEEVYVSYIDPIYEKTIGIFDGIEKDRVLTPEEKAEMEAAMTKPEKV